MERQPITSHLLTFILLSGAYCLDQTSASFAIANSQMKPRDRLQWLLRERGLHNLTIFWSPKYRAWMVGTRAPQILAYDAISAAYKIGKGLIDYMKTHD